jgi:AAA family ATP:ADP antiporter
MRRRLVNLLEKLVDVQPNEVRALIWSTVYFFLVLTAYYILRPIRDEMGVAGGVENLAWLFTGTLVGMLLLHPFYTWLVGRLPRRTFIPLTYRFFIANLILFFFVFRWADAEQAVWVGRVFFIWTSVFNLFVVSVFWSFMADIYAPDQSKRLFGMVAVGGTVGAILGSGITSALAEIMGPVQLMLVSAVVLEIAVRASNGLDRNEDRLAETQQHEAGEENSAPAATPAAAPKGETKRRASVRGSLVIGGGVLEGISHVLKSPYLIGIAALMLFYTITSTFVYFQQAEITAEVFGDDSASRTQLFANIDLFVNILTLVTQLFLTGRIMKWFGVGIGLAFLPVVCILGFGILAAAPVLAALVVFQTIRRAANYAIQRPAREVLYTVLARTDKYKAKNFNDTFVYRLGDQVGAWSYTLIGWLGLGVAGLSLLMVPFSAVWLVLAFWLGKRYVDRKGEWDLNRSSRPALGPTGA